MPLGQTIGAGAMAGLGLAAIMSLSLINFGDGQDRRDAARPAAGTQVPIKLSASELPGALTAIDKALTANSEHVFGALAMPKAEKLRLKNELEKSSMRIGGLTVWDTMDQDGDRIRITASGFSQDVVIEHGPKHFFIPYVPGGDVQILALQDGGGGGVTLGVKTSLGSVSLPHIEPGQIIEISLP